MIDRKIIDIIKVGRRRRKVGDRCQFAINSKLENFLKLKNKTNQID